MKKCKKKLEKGPKCVSFICSPLTTNLIKQPSTIFYSKVYTNISTNELETTNTEATTDTTATVKIKTEIVSSISNEKITKAPMPIPTQSISSTTLAVSRSTIFSSYPPSTFLSEVHPSFGKIARANIPTETNVQIRTVTVPFTSSEKMTRTMSTILAASGTTDLPSYPTSTSVHVSSKMSKTLRNLISSSVDDSKTSKYVTSTLSHVSKVIFSHLYSYINGILQCLLTLSHFSLK